MAVGKIQKADPAARRRAMLMVVFGATIGAVLIAGFGYFRGSLHEWLVSDPAETTFRARLVICAAALLLGAPLIAFAVYLWLLGVRVARAQQFPPPGLRVVRDTPVVTGYGAVTRGQVMQVVAVCLGAGAAILCLFFWWLTWTGGTVTQ